MPQMQLQAQPAPSPKSGKMKRTVKAEKQTALLNYQKASKQPRKKWSAREEINFAAVSRLFRELRRLQSRSGVPPPGYENRVPTTR